MTKRAYWIWMAALPVLAACDDSTGPFIERPTNLTYQLDPSGDPDSPAGLLLQWDPVVDPDLEVYNVYSRADGSSVFDLRGSTTSLSFHDEGRPDIEYYVTALNLGGGESDPSETVFIDELLRLESPSFLSSITLDGAVHLLWGDNPFQNEPTGFKAYRVYSTSYSIDTGECDETSWGLEGTTVSPEFIVSELTNGLGLCFGVSAESIEGWESLWSPLRADTPRPDARNVLVFRFGADPNFSGFRFFDDLNGDGLAGANELGIIRAGDANDIDFWVFQDANGDTFLEPVRADVSVALYSTDPIDDLTSIDLAPETGFSATGIQAVTGFGYVFEMPGGDQFARFGGVHVTHVGPDYIIFDWSYQTDPGNPELERHAGLPTFDGGDLTVKGRR